MRQLKHKHWLFLVTLTSFLFSACGQVGLSGILGTSGLMGATGGDELSQADADWSYDEDAVSLDDEDSDAYYDETGFSGASSASGDGYYYYDSEDEDDGLVEEETDSRLIGTGSLNPEQLPVPMSKLFPQNGECNASTENNIVGVTAVDGMAEVHMTEASPEDEEADASHARSAHKRSRSARFYLAPSAIEDEFVDTAYQCQYDDEEGFIWVEIEFEDNLDFVEQFGLELDFDVEE